MGKIKNMYPEMEYSTPRRVLATPLTAGEAKKGKIKLASTTTDLKELGFYVKEPVGDIVLEYWLPQDMFEKSSIRTKQYTIGEAMLLLMEGAMLTRSLWGQGQFIRFDNSIMVKEDRTKADSKDSFATLAAQVTRISIYPDPVTEGETEIVFDAWQPVLGDLLAKDWMVIKVDLKKIKKPLN